VALTLFEERKTIRILPQPLERGTDRKKKKPGSLPKQVAQTGQAPRFI
jgi:hypothetical protein